MEGVFSKQRGFYSEFLSPETAEDIKNELKPGPDLGNIIQINKKQVLPRAVNTMASSKGPKRNNGAALSASRLSEPEINEGLYSKLKAGIALVEPKVMEPYEPVKLRVPRKVELDRMIKQYKSLDIEELLLRRGVDLNNVPGHVQWIQLDVFDDKTFDDYSPTEWIEKAPKQLIPGKALRQVNGRYQWWPMLIHSWDEKKNEFQIEWEEGSVHNLNVNGGIGAVCVLDKKTKEVPKTSTKRIFMLFDSEDPEKFADRVAKAYRDRTRMDALIRYNYYIDLMPIQDLNEIDFEQKMRLHAKAKNTKALMSKDAPVSIDDLTNEVNLDYSRTTNRIIFNKYFHEANQELAPWDISECVRNEDEEEPAPAPELGMIQIPRAINAVESREGGYIYPASKDFTTIFKEFCFASLFIKDQVIVALQKIRETCADVLTREIFTTKMEKEVRLEEYRHIQESSLSQISYYLKGQWKNEMISIIKEQFENVGKGWFYMKETNRLTYEFGKLKRFLIVTRLNMQDTMQSLIHSQLHAYYKFIDEYLPHTVELKSASESVNIYTNGLRVPGIGDPLVKPKMKPLFLIDMIKVGNEDEFNYIAKPEKFCKEVLNIFEKSLEELKSIPDLEPLILDSLYEAKKNDSYILTPTLPNKEPEIPNPESRPKRYPEENKWVWDLFKEFEKMLKKSEEPMKQYLKFMEPYNKKLALKSDDFIKRMENDENPKSEEDIKQEILLLQQEEELLKKNVPETIHVSFFAINNREVHRALKAKFTEIIKKLTELAAIRAKRKTTQIMARFGELQKEIRKVPHNIEDLHKTEELIEIELPATLSSLKKDTEKLVEVFNMLEEFRYRFPKEDIQKRWTMIGEPTKLMEIVEERQKDFEKYRTKFLEKMLEDQENFKREIENMESSVATYYNHFKIDDHAKMASEVVSLTKKLVSMQEEARTYNFREGLFKRPVTDYSTISQIQRDFIPFNNLWVNVSYWLSHKDGWLHNNWPDVDAIDADRFCEEGYRTLVGVMKLFKGRNPEHYDNVLSKVMGVVKAQMDEFKPKVPLLVALKKEGMTDRHWLKISEQMGRFPPDDIKPTESFTFKDALNLGLMSQLNYCVETSERAAREYSIETQLNKMKSDWEEIQFKLNPFKNTYVIYGFDDIELVLDEHLSVTGGLLINPFRAQFQKEIDDWNNKMVLVSNILDEWKNFQGQWSYLAPIFDSPDISRQLPTESNMFKRVDANWKHTMAQTKAQQNVLTVCSSDGYLEKFKDANNSLDKITKELNRYLEEKKGKFARFYFLSNDELLSILSQTKEVERVQDHLRKVFENINLLEFDEQKKIRAMYSVENERVPMNTFVDPNHKQVEDWMREVEQRMYSSVREVLMNSILDYSKRPRNEWIKNHPGQCVLNGSQVEWTAAVEKAITENKVGNYLDFLNKQLTDTVKMDRAGFSKNLYVTLEALIVIDVHAKDVVEVLHKSKVDSISLFEWISQLRYYWEPIEPMNKGQCYVRCIQTNFPYGYEYLGNTARLVITPLTDKCYMTLMGALRLNLGGAPAGPAGTGKTETTKDLAKALAKQCVVFNCQESMGYQFVAKYFKGLASSGAWCCFDEFNRINLEVLSVIAQQLQDLFRAKAENITQLNFEGSEIRIISTFCVFITMNPGYAGRTELPDNLKALFRSVAMMVPNYAMIAEIKLYSFGFQQGRELSKRMVMTFKLSSEQLSSQPHYDYGMRAVSSVIGASGRLRRESPDQDEQKLLLRALRDVNVPKFLSIDLPLFENIIDDLFPGVERPQYNYGELLPSIKKSCVSLGLQPTEMFIGKILQLYDTILVRHGLMIVGPTGGGKTSNLKVLQKAISALDKGTEDSRFKKVNVEIINPKSVTMDQLYGCYKDMNWNEGVVEIVVQRAIESQATKEMQWVMFDGPVDALWIESMNTVLDDNKKLCLSSGKVLILSSFMTMMFEVEDLKVASPATVSRCGMVFMEPKSMGLQPLINSYINQLPEKVKGSKKIAERLPYLFKNLLFDTVAHLRKSCFEPVSTMDNNLVASLCRILECYLGNYHETETRKVAPDEITDLESRIDEMFVFALIWSVCCTVDIKGRMSFNVFLKNLMKEKQIRFTFPEEGTIYDYELVMEPGKTEWMLWIEKFKSFHVNKTKDFNEIVVPTNDYARMFYFMKLLLLKKMHVLCPGPTGTGKSINAFSLLATNLPDQFTSMSMTLSAQTTSNNVLDTVWGYIDKRRRGVYAPPQGKKLIAFIDDLNMPKKEFYGAQPPIELLRQFLDHEAWYIFKLNKEYTKIEDLILLSAMGPPGGGRTEITPRILRHFNILSYTELESSVIMHIFTEILNSFWDTFSESMRSLIPTIIEQSLKIYDTVKLKLLPIPSKSHYLFNLRDISNVMQGICMAKPKQYKEMIQLVRLWYHENFRVYHDRLNTNEDRELLKGMLLESIPAFKLDEKKHGVVLNSERMIFVDFTSGREGELPYIQISKMRDLMDTMEVFQTDYNNENVGGKREMKLEMFLDACEHICRICRTLRRPQGHMLLLGVGGSGRQSLTKIAAYILNYKLFQIEVVKGYNVPKWREDAKRVIFYAITENKPLTFLLVDTQVVHDQMLEDVNCLLNSGNVIGINYNQEEQKRIDDISKADCIADGVPASKINCYAAQIRRIKRNTHVVFALSPLGEKFTTSLRNFPAFINCSSIDWFTEWPEEALINVGLRNINEYEDEYDLKDMSKDIVTMFKSIHKHVEKISERYLQELRRHVYVTPTSYLELLKLYRNVLDKKTHDNNTAIFRLANGVEKLRTANEDITKLKEQLREEEPKLKKTEEDVKLMIESLSKKKAKADATKVIVQNEEKAAADLLKEASELKLDVQNELTRTEEELKKIIEKVYQLETAHINELKNLRNPPLKAKFVMWAVAYLFESRSSALPQVKANMSLEEKAKKFFEFSIREHFGSAPALLEITIKMVNTMQETKQCDMNMVSKIKTRLLSMKEVQDVWNDEAMMLASFPIYCMYLVIKGVVLYADELVRTQPLRDRFAEAEHTVKVKQEELAIKRQDVERINQKLQKLEETLQERQEFTRQLQEQIKMCLLKLERAKKLTDGLGDENARWLNEIETLKVRSKLIPGNSLIGAGMAAYAGPFTAQYRQELEKEWVSKLAELNIPHTEGVTMRKFLGDDVKIQQWNINGLPKDDNSTENGIIIDTAKRWPLMIDPQCQANKYIRNMGRDQKETGFDALKASSGNVLKILEQCITFGKWFLLENCPQNLDPSLEPIITQQQVKTGGSYTITIGEKPIPYSINFRFFMTTTMPNPHYSPETFAKVTIVNFGITPSGLEEQMLATIVVLENRQLEDQKNEIVRKNANDRKLLLELEDSILKSLSDTQGDILMNEELINTLGASKKTANEIQIRVRESKVTEKKIDEAREIYRKVAFRSSLLFFCVSDTSSIDPMYMFSLQWFENLFRMGVENAPQSQEADEALRMEERLTSLIDYFTLSLYNNVCRSLFERHKLMFSFMLTIAIMQGNKEVDPEEYRYLLTGTSGDVQTAPNPTKWIAKNSWTDMYKQLVGLDRLPAFSGILSHFMRDPDDFKEIFDSSEPQECPFPEPWNGKITGLRRTLLVKAIRMDKVLSAIDKFIREKMGKQFVEPPTFNLAECFKDSDKSIPLIFILSTGSDPKSDFDKFAEEEGIRNISSISLGQGQGGKAEAMIEHAVRHGGWVLLQNCHLAASWMERLEFLCEGLNDTANKDFRLWLTSMATPTFPISVLQNSVKMTLEPPQGLKSNLKRTYYTYDDKELNECKKPEIYKKLLFGLSFFHAIIQERKRYGAIGWNIAYEFTFEDLKVCKRQLRTIIDDYEEIDYKVIQLLTAEINYGGRVTDEKDVRLITTLVKSYLNDDVARKDGVKFSDSSIYVSPKAGDVGEYLNLIEKYPSQTSAEVFGLHENAEITTSQNETRVVLETLLSIQPRASSQGGKSREELMIDSCKALESKVPKVMNFKEISHKFQMDYNESMNTVLVQEVIRYNGLLKLVGQHIVQIQQALRGEVVMSETLENISNSIFNQQVPKDWEYPVGFLSLKPLSSWVEELCDRVAFLQSWVDNGTPNVFWISGFFFPQAFITGTLQNYARKTKIPINKIFFEYRIIDEIAPSEVRQKPPDGVYIYGLFLEGARWDENKKALSQPRPKELYSNLPMIWMLPRVDEIEDPDPVYQCPLYKVVSRTGTLLTTGHSTNFVIMVELPTKEPEDNWIRRGVACFTSLRY